MMVSRGNPAVDRESVSDSDGARQRSRALLDCRLAINQLPIGLGHIRRSLLFFVNIGGPALAGTIVGQPRAALPAAVVGMFFSLADNEGALPSRLRFLLLDAACLATGGLVGYFLRGNAETLWTAFALISLAVGIAATRGRELLLVGRHAIIAFTIAAVVPRFQVVELLFIASVFALAAASRIVDHLIAGPLPAQAKPAPSAPLAAGVSLPFAMAFAGAATAAFSIGGAFDPGHTAWVVATTVVVMQPDARGSYRRIVERLAGTFLGVFAARIITQATTSQALICAAILIVAPLIPHHLTTRYWLHTALVALMVILLYDLAELDARGIATLLLERVIDILLGCAIALAGTVAAFPRQALNDIVNLVVSRSTTRCDGEPN